MATWEDGPEYAPHVRPDEFSAVEVAPLESVPPQQHLAAGAPAQRPRFELPPVQVVPLTALVPTEPDLRDPEEPFAVVTSTLTSMDSAWGSAHWNAANGPAARSGAVPPGATLLGAPAMPPAAPLVPSGGTPTARHPTSAAPPDDPWGAAPTGSWPAPTAPLPPVTGPASLPGGYPPPGTPQWFGPGPVPQQPPVAPGPVDARAVVSATTPGVIICLLLAGVFYPLSPILLGLAFALSSQVKVAQQQVRQVFLTGLGFLGFFVLAGLLRDPFFFSEWWSFVGVSALVIAWVLLLFVLVCVYRALQRRRPAPPSSGYPSSWS